MKEQLSLVALEARIDHYHTKIDAEALVFGL